MHILDLYQELIIDHGTNPRNFKVLENATHCASGNNPLCGDTLTLYLDIKNDVIQDISFKGQGCAISMASSSLMSETLKGKTIPQAKNVFTQFQAMLTSESISDFDKLNALAGVKKYPMRVKCATLAWHAFEHALTKNSDLVTTE